MRVQSANVLNDLERVTVFYGMVIDLEQLPVGIYFGPRRIRKPRREDGLSFSLGESVAASL